MNLHILLHTEEAQNIELSRDMQIAISEYAPESEVVANGKLWTSRHVKRLPKKELLTYWFIQCSCGYFEKHLTATSDEFPQKFCPACGTRLLRIGRFVKPEFGFIAEPLSQTPRMERPRRTYSGRKFFSQSGSGGESKEFSFNGPVRLYSHAHGSLTVVNMGRVKDFTSAGSVALEPWIGVCVQATRTLTDFHAMAYLTRSPWATTSRRISFKLTATTPSGSLQR